MVDVLDKQEMRNGVWGKNLSQEVNITLAFVLDLQEEKSGQIFLSAASCFKLFGDGKMLGFGPNRAAHGYARISRYHFTCRYLTVEVHSINVENFCWIKQAPFFACFLQTQDGKTYSAENFSCYLLKDRVQKVQRYSFQRGFVEVYQMEQDRTSLYMGNRGCLIDKDSVEVPTLLKSRTSNAKLQEHQPNAVVERGAVHLDESKKVWRDRAHTQVRSVLQGYTIEEWFDFPTDEASRFVYKKGELMADRKYEIFDFGRAITGFIELEIQTDRQDEVYILFDEILTVGEGGEYVDFSRNDTSNVCKWTLKNKGDYKVATFEPYTAKYVCIVSGKDTTVKIKLYDFENPDAERFVFDCKDERLNKIMNACKATFAQNAVDILFDCPSRERAGWLSDSWFSSVAEKIFTGENKVEETFLENYLLSDCSRVENGLLPMCYPADLYFANIPNWSMWYILEVCKYSTLYGMNDLVQKSKRKVFEILEYFKGKENEFGLLENLTGWVFVEWSSANDASHICGVNIPSNMCYAACLEQAGELYGIIDWVKQAKCIRTYIKNNAFDGKFFVDNLIRNDEGVLVKTNNYTEVCQYYAFWLNCITKQEFSDLAKELIEYLGCHRADGYLPNLGKPNVMYGIYMRIDLLMRWGERERVLEECIKYFLPMAEKTGTLWEHNDFRASCVHGFASYVVRWIAYALTGKDLLIEGIKLSE